MLVVTILPDAVKGPVLSPLKSDKATLPVAEGVEVVKPNTKTSALSSHKKAALSPVDPLSIIIPESFALEEAPLFKPIILSDTSRFVWLTVVVVPLTCKSPDIRTVPSLCISTWDH